MGNRLVLKSTEFMRSGYNVGNRASLALPNEELPNFMPKERAIDVNELEFLVPESSGASMTSHL
jgi:hypothetical protein